MNKKFGMFLSAALLTASIGTGTALASSSTTPESNVTVQATDTGIIKPFSVILDTSYTYNNGQGTANFNWKYAGHDETVRVYVKNNSAKAINYKLLSPLGTNFVNTTLQPGEQSTTQHSFAGQQNGNWTLKFDNSYGSVINVDVAVRDGL